MEGRLAMGIFALAAGLGLSGCASVSSTAEYYLPYSSKVYPPKPPEAVIPILAKAPDQRFTPIGKLAFSTDQGWRFLRASMLYNARQNGADAVVVRKVETLRQVDYVRVPSRMEWVPVPVVSGKCNGRLVGYTAWVPDYQPGYVRPYERTTTTLDAEMVVWKPAR